MIATSNDSKISPFTTDRGGRWRRWSVRLLWAVLMAATAWFFIRVWRNIETLSERTLPGLQYASAMIDRAADLQVARLRARGNAGEVQQAVERLREVLRDYEKTSMVEQDRLNIRLVEEALDAHLSAGSDASAERLRAAVRTLHTFRHGRAMMFASDSRDGFTSALLVNTAGLVVFALLSLVTSLFIGMRSFASEPRPDDF